MCRSTALISRRVQIDVTELNWRGLVFDELSNGQAVLHYSRHRLTVYVTTLTYASTNDQWARLAKTQTVSVYFTLVQFSYVAL